MIKNVENCKLISLLTGDNSEKRRFVIPKYQREYKWGKEHINEFIVDIFEAYDIFKTDPSYSHFFGAIITEIQKEKSQEGFVEYHLIDGQQRITTSMLFIKLLDNLYKNEIESNNINIIKDTKVRNTLTQLDQMLWSDGIPENKNCKLKSDKEGESPLLLNIFLNLNNNQKTIFDENYKLLNKEYESQIKEREDFKLSDFIEFVFNNLEFVQVDTDSKESALKIFSVLNTRGLDLSSTDIIKAEAMADLKNPTDSNNFDLQWRKLEKQALDLDINFETIFRYYINMYEPSSIVGTNDKNIKNIWNNNSFKNDKILALQDFNKFVQCLEYIWKMNDAYIWCLRHLLSLGKNAYTWVPVLVSMKYRDYSDQDIKIIAKFITRWTFIHLVHGWTIEKVKAFNFSIIKEINNKNSIDNILKMVPKITSDGENTEESLVNNFHPKLKSLDIYKQKWGRPLLFFLHNLEILKHDGKAQSFIFKPLTKDDSVEHIRPQNSSDRAWIKCSDDKKHVIGNLSILPLSENSSVGTDYFKKAKAYDKVLYAFNPSLSAENPWSDERIDQRSDEIIFILCKSIDINSK